MRFRKRWLCLLFVLFCIGVSWIVTRYQRSSRYRAAVAFARIQEGMSLDEAEDILGVVGVGVGYPVNFAGWSAWDLTYSFGDDCCIRLNVTPSLLSSARVHRVRDKCLERPTITEWFVSLVRSAKGVPSTQSAKGSPQPVSNIVHEPLDDNLKARLDKLEAENRAMIERRLDKLEAENRAMMECQQGSRENDKQQPLPTK